jgi:hypothetical protein
MKRLVLLSLLFLSFCQNPVKKDSDQYAQACPGPSPSPTASPEIPGTNDERAAKDLWVRE